MKVLLDTNVVLDVLLAREPHLANSKAVWQACDNGQINGYIIASALTDIYYIARKIVGLDSARHAVEICLSTFQICPVNQAVLENAFQLAGSDFEDDVQIAAATQAELDVVVTRNPRDFMHGALAVVVPAELLAQL